MKEQTLHISSMENPPEEKSQVRERRGLTKERIREQQAWESDVLERLHQVLKQQKPQQEQTAGSTVETQKYQQRYLPKYLAEKSDKPAPLSPLFHAVLRIKEMMGRVNVNGRENIPAKGPFLVVSNHSGGETGALYGILHDEPLRIAAGEELNWKRSPLRAWLLRAFGMLSVRESLSHLSEKEQQDLLNRVPGKARQHAYANIIEHEKDPGYALANAAARLQFVREAVAALSRGDVVAVFPEGPFLYNENTSLRQAYGGIEVILREYARVTKKNLPILPIAIRKKSIIIGESFLANDSRTATDQSMHSIAALLPENQRGYYGR